MGTQYHYDSVLIAERVREARQAVGLSQRYTGEQLGLTEAAYGHYERHRQKFTVEQVFSLSRVLGRPVEWLLGISGQLSEDEWRVLALYRRADELGESEVALRLLMALVSGKECRE